MPEIQLSCACGKIKGHTKDINANSGNRIVCCCIDCQKFAIYLEKEDVILDEYAGTDIFQMPLSHLKITKGNEHIACVKLTEKGLHRWYSNCCKTPIGNTLGSKAPFIGVIHNFMENTATRDLDLGPSLGIIHWQSAKSRVPEQQKVSFFKLTMRVVGKLISWKIRGLNRPSAFFDSKGQTIVKPIILN
jgi:hypothetical protein